MLKVFWTTNGNGRSNFGDQLTPLLLDYVGIPFEWAPAHRANFFGVGSILHEVPEHFDGMIWSSGLSEPCAAIRVDQARVGAVRGRQSLQALDMSKAEVVLGDGGLLAYLFHRPCRKRYKLGLIPDGRDLTQPQVKLLAEQSTEISLIDSSANPLEMMEAVGKCESILSSSLDGLIVADALGIPSRWVEFVGGGADRAARFKITDYYSAVALEDAVPVPVESSCTVDQLLELPDLNNHQRVAKLQADLLESLRGLLGAQSVLTPLATEPMAERNRILEGHLKKNPVAFRAHGQPCTLEEAKPTLTSTPGRFASFCRASVELMASLHAQGFACRTISSRTLGVAGGHPKFLDLGWALPLVPEQTENWVHRDWTNLARVLDECCPPSYKWIRLVLRQITVSTPGTGITDRQVLLGMFQAAEELSFAETAEVPLNAAAQLLRELDCFEQRTEAILAQTTELQERVLQLELALGFRQLARSVAQEDRPVGRDLVVA